MISTRTNRQNIILIGMPGVGKSTSGVFLAEQIGYAFIDTDITLQVEDGRRLSAIIAEEGIDGFQRIEENHILGLSCRAHVIATGGSVVYSDRAMAHLKSFGRIVHLDIDPLLLQKRLGDLDARGVVRPGGKSVADLYAERRPLYRLHQDTQVRCDGLTPEQVVEEILKKLSA